MGGSSEVSGVTLVVGEEGTKAAGVSVIGVAS